MMRLSACLLGVLMFSALLANLSPAEAGGGSCQAALVGKSYDCNIAYSSTYSPEAVCFEFETGGFSNNFDLYLDLITDYGCSCETTGTYNSPSFDDSGNTFDCISDAEGYLLTGKIKGKKITGQGTSEGGISIIYTCTLRKTPC
jgi:hypothetical protein